MGGAKRAPVDYLKFANSDNKTLLRQGWFIRLTLAGLSTLTLGTMGSAVLPLAATFADTGIVAGFIILFLVCFANVYTSRLILKQVRATGAPDYETLGNKVLGPWWRLFTEFSNWLLLFGTIMGGIAQLGEAGSAALQMIWCPAPAEWIVAPDVDGTYHGRILMVLYVVILVMPWSMVKEMKQLDMAGVVGYPIVLWMTFSIVVRCIQEGFPAIGDGGLPIVGFTSLSQVAGSVSTWAFAFYIQPLMLPLYSEMPPGNVGYLATFGSVNGVLLGTALLPYVLIGFFGAALWGQAAVETGNVLLNDIYGEMNADGSFNCPSAIQGSLNICMTVYLAITIPPLDFALRHTVNSWVSRLKKTFPSCLGWIPKRNKGWGGWARNTAISILDLSLCLGLALAFPANSATILTVTGASGVLLVSFVIPIVNHFVLLFNKGRCQREGTRTLSLAEAKQKAANASMRPADEGSVISGGDSYAAGELHHGSLMTPSEFAAQEATHRRAGSAVTVDSLLEEGGASGVKRPGALRVGFASVASESAYPGTPSGAYAKDVSPDIAFAPGGTGMPDAAQLQAINAITSDDPESYRFNPPVTNDTYAAAFADPASCCKPKPATTFWLLDVAIPLLVLAFGVFCSVCTLVTTDWSVFAPQTTVDPKA